MSESPSLAWNLGDLFELVADTVPDRLALAHGVDGPTRSWRDLDRRANALAHHFARSHQPGDKLALYAYNRPEFVETLTAAFKARLVPVNVNYRYREEELVYLLDNSDATVVVYEACFADRVAKVRDRLPDVREWMAARATPSRSATTRSSAPDGTTASTSRAARATCSSCTPAAPPACRRA
jgi:acyl-CoA synthetase (AMP-forming)/AMP-acid ligase II